MEKTRILVVDDEERVCDIAQRVLVAKDYQVFCATTPDEAIQLAASEYPKIVLLDIRLGNTSGLDLLPKLKKIDKKLKIIMLTALEDTETIQKAKARGADGFIVKPFDLELLDKIIAQTLSKLRSRPDG